MATEDVKALRAFFREFRKHTTDSAAELPAFFQQFRQAYRLARSNRVAATPHLDVLGVFGLEFAELRHSDALAWFLDPEAEHDQGALFANALLELIGLKPLTSENYTVARERHERTDVAFYAQAQLAVFIENKVRAKERDSQVCDVVKSLVKLSGILAIRPERGFVIFLTDPGDKPVTAPKADTPDFSIMNLHSLGRVDVFECFRATLAKQPVYSPLLMNFIDSYLYSIRRVRSLLA